MRVPERFVWVFAFLLLGEAASAQTGTNQLLNHSGTVVLRRLAVTETNPPPPKGLQQRDLIRTLEQSTALIALEDRTQFRMREFSVIEIPAPRTAPDNRLLNLLKGTFYFFSREKPKAAWLQTPHVTGATRGTEFLVLVEDERTTFVMYDGEVLLDNQVDPPMLVNPGEAAIAQPGQPLRKARIETLNIVQWWLFYPAVIDLDEVQFTPEEKGALKASLDAYRTGDLLAALERYPQGRVPASDAERVYYAGLQLALGEVGKAEEVLGAVTPGQPLANALRTLIAAVNRKPAGDCSSPLTASELLAHSYLDQSEHRLKAALAAARKAAEKSSRFSFAWHRVAELEFSFGHTRAAKIALERSLALAPRNAQARALFGYVLAAENRIAKAIEQFNLALEIDYHLGNAWLGRGLCKLRSGLELFGFAPDSQSSALHDLQAAVIMEPNRSALRAYLGKAFGDAGDYERATLELALARSFDTNDPTPFLYSALLKNEQNQINEAINDLEQSQERNDNRAVYRSQFLLDQDRAVRSASLAPIYHRAGMEEVSLREAARAVTYDYANYSAHLFLANSYDALRDPTRFNLRYETAWFNELLLANMLAPVGAGALSQNISQQEYSRLFEANGIGLISDSSWRSDDQFRQLASHYGTFGNASYSLDLDYQHNAGVRPNNELDRIEWYSTIKQQLTPQDSLLILAKYQDYHSGDNFQYYDPTNARPNFTFDEYQSPIVLAGYHREWTPGVHTLLLGGRLENDQRFSDKAVSRFVFNRNLAGTLTSIARTDFDVDYRSQFEAWTSEINQIFQTKRNTLILGGRFQTGEFKTRNELTNVTVFTLFFPPVDETIREDFQRWSVYGYDTWEAFPDQLWLTAGLAYDTVKYPANHRQVPISGGEDTDDRLGPKAALVWSPLPEVTLRGAYTRSIGGVTLDQSYRLEPPQLAGFNQSFRTVISESLAGSVSAPTFDVYGAALDLKFGRTYIGVIGELLESEVDRVQGTYVFQGSGPGAPASAREELDYREYSAAIAVNQLLSDEWALGAAYKFTRANLEQALPEVPLAIKSDFHRFNESDLHTWSLFLLYNHPVGLFARAEANWYWQENSGWTNSPSGQRIDLDLPGDDFPQIDFWLGYRFPRNFGEVALGLLNATDTDYRLNPLTPYAELPRERVFAARLRLRF